MNSRLMKRAVVPAMVAIAGILVAAPNSTCAASPPTGEEASIGVTGFTSRAGSEFEGSGRVLALAVHQALQDLSFKNCSVVLLDSVPPSAALIPRDLNWERSQALRLGKSMGVDAMIFGRVLTVSIGAPRERNRNLSGTYDAIRHYRETPVRMIVSYGVIRSDDGRILLHDELDQNIVEVAEWLENRDTGSPHGWIDPLGDFAMGLAVPRVTGPQSGPVVLPPELTRRVCSAAGSAIAARARSVLLMLELEQAWLLQQRGLPIEADARAAHAVSLYEEQLGSRHPDLAAALALQAYLLHGREPARALEIALRAEQIRRDHLAVGIRNLPEMQALQYAARGRGSLDVALWLASGGASAPAEAAEVMDAVIRTRSLVTDEMASRHRTLVENNDSKTSQRFEDWTAASQELARLIVLAPTAQDPKAHLQAVRDAAARRERAEEELARVSGAFRRRRALERAGFTEIARSLRPGMALVSYVRGDTNGSLIPAIRDARPATASPGARSDGEYYALILRSGRMSPDIERLGSSRDIDSLVMTWRRRASYVSALAGMNDRASGEALRRRIWDPVARRLGLEETVFLVPDGSLHLVSFMGLPVGGDRYLAEENRTIRYLSSERDLLLDPDAQKLGMGLIAVGGPAFDAVPGESQVLRTASNGSSAESNIAFRGHGPECPDFAGFQFAPLPETIREVEEIASLWNRSLASSRGPRSEDSARVLTGSLADEGTFKARCRGRRIVHLATHGFFLDEACLSRVPEVGTGRLGGGSGARSEHPLHLSGLALASANRRSQASSDQEDGVLTAEEVAALDLSGVEWAVLSACETGVGEIRVNEGVFGLQRAFRVAGARTVIMSLWAVEDAAAREWMDHLYRARFTEGLATPEAARQASLRVLNERRRRGMSTSPYAWAAFVASGF